MGTQQISFPKDLEQQIHEILKAEQKTNPDATFSSVVKELVRDSLQRRQKLIEA